MEEESQPSGTLIVRAWRNPDGKLAARITYGVDGHEPALEMSAAQSETEVITVLRGWMERIGP